MLSTVKGTNIDVIFDNSGTTEISDVPAPVMKIGNGIFNLNGQQLNEMPERGIFIIDGKKVKMYE